MIAAARHSVTLAALVLGVAALDVAVHRAAEPPPPLPALPAVDPAGLTGIALTRGDLRVELRREGEAWTVAGEPADPLAVRALLEPLAEGARMDVRVDEGALDRYGLKIPDVVRVELEGDPALAFYVGHNAPGGASFVRLADDPAVYRARVGGRSRYERADFRDPTLLAFAPTDLRALRITGEGGETALTRDAGWRLPDGPADAPRVASLVQALSGWRGLEIPSPDHPTGLDRPAGTLRLSLPDGERVVRLGRTATGAYAALEGGRHPVRVSPELVDALLAPAATWRDRSLANAADPVSARLETPGGARVLERVDGRWALTTPPGVAVNEADVERVVRALATLRAERMVDIPPAAAGFPGALRLTISDADGEHGIEVGGPVPGEDAFYVRGAGTPDAIGVISGRLLLAIRRAFADPHAGDPAGSPP